MDFVTLKELVRIVTPAKMRNIEILGYASDKDTPLAALYECIAKGNAKSDEEAAEMVLGAKASRKKYNTLRNRLVRQLIHSAFLIDPSHVWQTDRVEAYHHCLLNLAAASIPTVRNTSLVVYRIKRFTGERVNTLKNFFPTWQRWILVNITTKLMK